ncbi:phage terminase large subunit family protein [Oscillospiraceae bacterium OttesenSCG-928-F05]|nr:phage terminase large subunit family protein [Oscillospiraceae bacterium OttesenSCG-928-F05]
MELRERAAYLKGLMDGLKLDTSTDERKILHALVEGFEDVSAAVEALSASNSAVAEALEALPGQGGVSGPSFNFSDMGVIELDCPGCGKPIEIDEDMLRSGQFLCPHCGQQLAVDQEGEGGHEHGCGGGGCCGRHGHHGEHHDTEDTAE